MSNSKHKAKKIEAGHYEYRGFEIERNHDVPAGYYASWVVYTYRNFNSSSLKNVKAKIDDYYLACVASGEVCHD